MNLQNHASALLRVVLITALLTTMFGLVGCKSSPTRVTGRVIPGTVGQAMVIGPNDTRLDEPGIPDVEVIVLHAGGSAARGRGVVGKATTDEDGNFEFSIPGGKHPGASVMVRVKGEWIFAARSQTYLPTNAQKLLCTVITRDGYAPPTLEEDEPSNE